MKLLIAAKKTFAKNIGQIIKKMMAAEFTIETDSKGFVNGMKNFKPDVILFEQELKTINLNKALRITRERSLRTVFIVLARKYEMRKTAALVRKGVDDFIFRKKLTALPAAIRSAMKRHQPSFLTGHAMFFHNSSQKMNPGSGDPYLLVLERITDGFIALDNNFCYKYVNKRVGELVRRDPASLIGKNVWEEFPDAVGSATYKAFNKAMKEQKPASNVDYYAPLDLWHENYIYPSADGLSIFIKDISDRKKLEIELLEQQKEHHVRIAATALEAQEKERTNIGKELHDNVNQILVATKMWLCEVKKRPRKKAATLVPLCISNLDKVIDENRKIAHELITPDLSIESLCTQLENQILPMLKANGIETKLNTVKLNEKLLDRDKKLNVYRIAQEQCTNIVKYAKAKHAVFELMTEGNEFIMTIADDGRGTAGIKANKGIGLRNIQGRVEIFNGRMEVCSREGEGFQLKVCMPLT